MQSETFHSLIKPIETIQRKLWLAFLATVPMYVCLAYVQVGRPTSGVTPLQATPLAVVVVTMSLLAAVLGPYVPRLMFSESRLRKLLSRGVDPETLARDPKTGTVNEERLARIKSISPDEQRLLALVPTFFGAFIVRLAFNESIVLYGLLMAFFSGALIAILPFAIVSFALNLIVPSPLNMALERTASLGLQPGVIPPRPG
jgi:hypothetical protein